MTLFASCQEHNWEVAVASEAEKDRREQAHLELRHGLAPAEPTLLLDTAAWEGLADAAVAAAAARSVATGESFLLWEVLRDAGVPAHPDPKTGMGKYATKVHRRGLAHPCAFDKDPNQSAIRRWTGDPARCSDVEHRGVLIP